MNTTEAIAAIRGHIANGTDIDDATLKDCAPLLATNVNARDAIIMCTLRPEDVSLDLALDYALHPRDKTSTDSMKQILLAVLSGSRPIQAQHLDQSILLFERMRNLDTPEHRNDHAATLLCLAWIADDTPRQDAYLHELGTDNLPPSLARIVLFMLQNGTHAASTMS